MSSTRRNVIAMLGSSLALWAGMACTQRRPDATELRVALSLCDTVSRVQSAIPLRVPTMPRAVGNTSGVVGAVQDRQTGAALAGVVLRFDGMQRYDARTDSAGGFFLNDLASGTYRVLVTRMGYDAVRDTLKLAAGKLDTVHYHLQYRSCP